MPRFKNRAARISLLLCLALLLTCLAGCGGKGEQAADRVQSALAKVDPEDLRITVCFSDPRVMTRAPMTLEQLLACDFCDVFHLSGEETAASVQVLREELRPEMVEAVKPSGRMNARVYYLLETGTGDKLLELIVYAEDGTLYFNGVEVRDHEIFYRIIYPCLGDLADELWAYFGSVDHTGMSLPEYRRSEQAVVDLIAAALRDAGESKAEELAKHYFGCYEEGLILTGLAYHAQTMPKIREAGLTAFPEDLKSIPHAAAYAVELVDEDGNRYIAALTEPETRNGEEALYKNGEQIYRSSWPPSSEREPAN